VHNSLDPALMSPGARRTEAAAILATGFLRFWVKQVDGKRKALGVLRPPETCCCRTPSQRHRCRISWCRIPELNGGHRDFRSRALPHELTRHANLSVRLGRFELPPRS